VIKILAVLGLHDDSADHSGTTSAGSGAELHAFACAEDGTADFSGDGVDECALSVAACLVSACSNSANAAC